MASAGTETQIRRLFIGNLSSQLVESLDDLTARISKFGEIKSSFELHTNEVRQTSFGYININISEEQYSKLKSSLNGVKFKGNKLIIDLAKETYNEKWTRDDLNRNNEDYEKKQFKQQWEFNQKINNINKSFRDHQELMKGRERKIPRKDIKKMTFRLILNGNKRYVKCYKTKLWGYEKNKKLRDLVYRFINGSWKDGNDHIVERRVLKLNNGKDNLIIERVENQRDDDDDDLLKNFGDDEKEEKELETNNKVLASILGNFDFDKPLDYKADAALDDFGESDYEYQGADHSDDDDEMYNHDLKSSNAVDLSKIEYIKEGEFKKEKTVNFDAQDDDYDDDYNNKQEDGDYNIEHEDPNLEGNSDEDFEFIPTFGNSAPKSTQQEESSKKEEIENHQASIEQEELEPDVKFTEGTISNTETLRTLFNPNEDSGFQLVDDQDEDIDKDSNQIVDPVEIPEISLSILKPSKNSKGLFFPHFDSPFLTAQTQLSKLNSALNFDNWNNEGDDSFWNKRSEWTRDFKRRKRDVQRQLNKKNSKSSKLIV
ncbi:hypothetical protein WICMUC_004705 [Wickerhamomyces mucosus]|uniref:RRM domain-containing protein n=1 Tax=Wickerhamomyces mucosus TaxID=1378264 RepID=A0A9P8PFP5_9ASCO|nr:hypothetical protein WICMUC_004705 [Wickerhamomyces mucosus]